MEILAGECSLYLNYLVQSTSLFGAETANGVPTLLLLALHP